MSLRSFCSIVAFVIWLNEVPSYIVLTFKQLTMLCICSNCAPKDHGSHIFLVAWAHLFIVSCWLYNIISGECVNRKCVSLRKDRCTCLVVMQCQALKPVATAWNSKILWSVFLINFNVTVYISILSTESIALVAMQKLETTRCKSRLQETFSPGRWHCCAQVVVTLQYNLTHEVVRARSSLPGFNKCASFRENEIRVAGIERWAYRVIQK